MSYKDNTILPERVRDITPEEVESLMIAVTEAHYRAGADNDSISRSVFRATYEGSGDVMKGIAAAILSIGGKHGPLFQARGLIGLFHLNPVKAYELIDECLQAGEKVPGFGNSFFKTEIDPAFEEVYLKYADLYSSIYGVSETSNPVNLLWERFSRAKYDQTFKYGDKCVYPNAALITGAVAHLCQGVPYIENWTFITGRSRAWIESLSLPEAPKEATNDTNEHPFKKGAIVRYGGSDYEVAGNKVMASGLFIGIYDEPPSKHIDWIQAASLQLVKEA